MYVLKNNGNVMDSNTGRVVGTVTEVRGLFYARVAGKGVRCFDAEGTAFAYVQENAKA